MTDAATMNATDAMTTLADTVDAGNLPTRIVDPTEVAESLPDDQELAKIRSELNINDSNSIIAYGSDAKLSLTKLSENMLESVKNKDLGPVGESLNQMVLEMRGLDFDSIDPNKKKSIFKKILGKSKPLVKFLQKYESVSSQVEVIQDSLNRHRIDLTRDVIFLDLLYEESLQYFKRLNAYISVAEEALENLKTNDLPRLEKKANTAQANAIGAQAYRNLVDRVNMLERTVHDLKLTRQITLQSLPSIRMMQTNNIDLIRKIHSQILNTIPLWKQQLAVAITQWRQKEAASATKAVSDFQNQLLEQNAQMLKETNAAVREEIERGVYDIESVRKANDMLIDAINDAIRIADEAKQKRKAADEVLVDCAVKLKNTLGTSAAI